MLKVVEKPDGRKAGEDLWLLDEIAREGARRMLLEALKAEVDDYVERHHSEHDEQGHALVVRNGHGQTRKVTLGAGTVALNAPRVNDRRLDSLVAVSASPAISCRPICVVHPRSLRCLPILYLRGLSTGDFRPALEALLGEDASGLSPATIARLTAGWEKEYTEFRRRDLSEREYVIWVVASISISGWMMIGSVPW